MKTSKFILLTFLSLSLVMLSACKDDPADETVSYVGEYAITKATISEPITMQTNELADPLVVPAGTIITQMIQDALLGALECETENSLIELREDFSLFISCSSSMEELDGGTWTQQSETVLILNLNSTAIPNSPTGIVLTVTDVNLSGNLLTGSTSVPVSREVLAGIVTLMTGGNATLDMEATPAVQPMSLTIEMTKQ